MGSTSVVCTVLQENSSVTSVRLSIPNWLCERSLGGRDENKRGWMEKEKDILKKMEKERKNGVLAEDQRVLGGKCTGGRNIGKKEGIKWD